VLTRFFEKLRQLGDVGRDPLRFIAGVQFCYARRPFVFDVDAIGVNEPLANDCDRPESHACHNLVNGQEFKAVNDPLIAVVLNAVQPPARFIKSARETSGSGKYLTALEREVFVATHDLSYAASAFRR
jgi:hypothetical protein